MSCVADGLPNGWVHARIADVALGIFGGGTPSRGVTDYFGEEIPWFTPTEIPRGLITTVVHSRESITELGLKKSSAKILPAGSVLLTSRATIGNVAIAGRELTTNQGFASIVCPSGILNYYVAYWLLSVKRKLNEKATGTTFKEISKSKLGLFEFPLPPLPEQHRIVAKIEELFSDLDAGVAALKKVKAELKRYRQAVLKAAVEGKLTEEWRRRRGDGGTRRKGDGETRSGKDESVQELLQRIRTERAKNGKARKLPPIDTAGLPKLPEGWEWTRVGDVAELCLGKMLDKVKNKGEYQPYLRNINVRWGAFDMSDLNQMRFEKDEDQRYGLLPGDLVVCEGGEPGRAAVWTGAPGVKIQKALHRVRFIKDKVMAEFLLCYLQYAAQYGILKKYFTGTTIKHLTGVRLAEFVFPLPPPAEQQQIVSEVENTVEAGLKQAERLRQSILKRAFEGKLVPQDPSDEPAEKLLERIRIQRQEDKKLRSLEGRNGKCQKSDIRNKKEKK